MIASVFYIMVPLKRSGLMILVTAVIAATELTDIVLELENQSSNISAGKVLLKNDDSWFSICHYGDGKTWGKKEALVACRQLHFQGGWPYDVKRTVSDRSHRHFSNFDCDWAETELKSCSGYEITDECTHAKLAGVQCYGSFEVQLVDGVTPNVGRVEVRYGDMWSNVCYESATSKTRQWSFYNVQVVCRELGFPGAMFAKQGGQGKGTRQTIVNGYKCREDLREASLETCLPDSPIMVLSSNSSPSCGYTSTMQGNEAVAICAVPGYIGCVERAVLTTSFELTSAQMTINLCRRRCLMRYSAYASLCGGGTCFCGDDKGNHVIGDAKCREECTGDSYQVCGDIDALSVYSANEGMCEDPLKKADTYYYGDIFDDFKCDPGLELVGTTTIQCVMGNSTDDMQWNDTFPECRDMATSTQDESGDNYGNNNKQDKISRGMSVIVVIAASAGGALTLVILIAILVFCLRNQNAAIENHEDAQYAEIRSRNTIIFTRPSLTDVANQDTVIGLTAVYNNTDCRISSKENHDRSPLSTFTRKQMPYPAKKVENSETASEEYVVNEWDVAESDDGQKDAISRGKGVYDYVDRN